MSSQFNVLYHGSMDDVSTMLENGVELDARLTGALLCNIVRTVGAIQDTCQSLRSRQGEAVDGLRWTCHGCEHVWIAIFDPEYGEHDDDCPKCGSRHNSPERIEVRIR